MQHETLRPHVHRVAGVRAALIPDNPVRALGEHVDQFALAFITPLRADYHHRARRGVEHAKTPSNDILARPRHYQAAASTQPAMTHPITSFATDASTRPTTAPVATRTALLGRAPCVTSAIKAPRKTPVNAPTGSGPPTPAPTSPPFAAPEPPCVDPPYRRAARAASTKSSTSARTAST